MTEWRPIPSLPGYEISNGGEVRRTVSLPGGLRPRALASCTFPNGYRYVQVTINGRKGRRAFAIHRLICEAFNGPAPEGCSLVRHLDGNRINNTPANLKWGTTKQNARDRRLHGRDLCGTKSPTAKIDDHDVIAIFCLRRRGMTGEEIAELFGLNRNQVNKIIARKSWFHVYVPDDLARAALDREATYTGKIPVVRERLCEDAPWDRR